MWIPLGTSEGCAHTICHFFCLSIDVGQSYFHQRKTKACLVRDDFWLCFDGFPVSFQTRIGLSSLHKTWIKCNDVSQFIQFIHTVHTDNRSSLAMDLTDLPEFSLIMFCTCRINTEYPFIVSKRYECFFTSLIQVKHYHHTPPTLTEVCVQMILQYLESC